VRSLRLRGAPPPRKWRTGAGNTRGAGARSSFGWQTSVGRIARLLHRGVARPVGGQRALAWKKSLAPPDAEHGWTEGETVRVCAVSTKSLRARGLRVSACRFSIRQKAFSDGCPSCFHRQGDAKVLRLVGQLHMVLREEGLLESRSGGLGLRLGCACGRRWERQRSTRFGEGSSRIEKSAGSPHPRRSKGVGLRGAPHRDRPKLTTANSFVDPPLP